MVPPAVNMYALNLSSRDLRGPRGNSECWRGMWAMGWTFDQCCHSATADPTYDKNIDGNWACWANPRYNYFRCCFAQKLQRPCRVSPDENSKTKEVVANLVQQLQHLYGRHGFHLAVDVQKGASVLLSSGGTTLDVGGGIGTCDMELFRRLSSRFASRRIFVIGNAFGLSALVLATAFPNAAIDVIDAELWGSWVVNGSVLTRNIVEEEHLDVMLTIGFSPLDTLSALRGQVYDLVFIDGKHSHRQLVEDFAGIEPYLAVWSIVILHDVVLCDLQSGVAEIVRTWRNMDLHYLEYRGLNCDNHLGTGILVKGWDVSTWCDIASEPYWATYLQREKTQ